MKIELDCRRANMRFCDQAQNAWNVGPNAKSKSGFKGVKWHKKRHKWYVMISVRGKRFWIGAFDDPREGAIAYDRAAIVYHGKFARTNILRATDALA